MFEFFKKKTEQPGVVNKKAAAAPATSSLQGKQGPVAEETVKADNIAIHVMPGRFRNQPVKQNSAKTMGLAIIIGGAVFLIVASGALYYFLFKRSNVVITEEPSLIVQSQTSQTEAETSQAVLTPDNLVATGTEMMILPTEEEAAATTIATSSPEVVPAEVGLSLSIGTDDDNDGLTNIEEILLGTSTSTPDTDGDGYLDGSELVNLYNPAGEGKLTANSNISLYENKTFAYDLLYPSTWQTSINGGDDSLMFKTGDNQFVQVIVQPNVNKQTLDEWYMEQLGVLTINEADKINGSNWQGIKNPDGLNIYLMDKKQNYIFSLTYNLGGANVLEYMNIFQMMVKSFTLK